MFATVSNAQHVGNFVHSVGVQKGQAGQDIPAEVQLPGEIVLFFRFLLSLSLSYFCFVASSLVPSIVRCSLARSVRTIRDISSLCSLREDAGKHEGDELASKR